MKNSKRLWIVFILALLVAPIAKAADSEVVEMQLTLSNHTFDPQSLTVPSGKKIKLTIVNKDASAAEFESEDLRREKIIPANGQIYVYIGPLDAGTYGYFDDFHRSTTTGIIVAQ